LGGLAGNNAHGAGVLQAALECDKPPQMISCSSGQIHWVHRYLACREKEQREGVLRKELTDAIADVSPTKMEAVDAAIVSVTGRPNVFRPALAEFPLNIISNLATAFANILTNATKNWQAIFSAHRELARILPSQVLIPLFPDSYFRHISDKFNQTHDVGLLFNSYDFKTGEENVYCNECAREWLDIKFGDENSYRRGTTYRRITPEAVREGLWIYEYGEPHDFSGIDGAYYRQIILSELSPAHTIYVARPINSRWIGPFPKSWVGLQDLKTEVNFNGSYAGERDKIELINRLVREKTIPKEKGYHQIKVEEIEIQSQRGYFDYAQESVSVFDQAYNAARSVLPANSTT
jgi:hypothetical protein